MQDLARSVGGESWSSKFKELRHLRRQQTNCVQVERKLWFGKRTNTVQFHLEREESDCSIAWTARQILIFPFWVSIEAQQPASCHLIEIVEIVLPMTMALCFCFDSRGVSHTLLPPSEDRKKSRRRRKQIIDQSTIQWQRLVETVHSPIIRSQSQQEIVVRIFESLNKILGSFVDVESWISTCLRTSLSTFIH